MSATGDEHLGRKLRALRRDDKLALKQAARAAGVSVSTMSDYERGAAMPTVLQSESLVRSYLESHPDHAPAWQEFCEAAEASNTLEALGISAVAGVAEPERPQELGRVSIT